MPMLADEPFMACSSERNSCEVAAGERLLDAREERGAVGDEHADQLLDEGAARS